jgi:hypothetical protein
MIPRSTDICTLFDNIVAKRIKRFYLSDLPALLVSRDRVFSFATVHEMGNETHCREPHNAEKLRLPCVL